MSVHKVLFEDVLSTADKWETNILLQRDQYAKLIKLLLAVSHIDPIFKKKKKTQQKEYSPDCIVYGISHAVGIKVSRNCPLESQ